MTLFVLLGAGASYDAASVYEEEAPQHPSTRRFQRPPLATQLFEPRWAGIINQYPMVKNAAPNIRDAMAGHDGAEAVSLEDHLRERYRDSADEYDRRRFFSVAPYLQHVLWEVGRDEGLDPDNLNRLVNGLTDRYEHVCFVTLNYDTLLDRCLYALDRIDALAHYIGYARWSLVKIHGSINWGFKIDPAVGLDPHNPTRDTDQRIDTSTYYRSRRADNINELRIGEEGNSSFPLDPALSAPLGPEDEVVCPPVHLEHLKQRLDGTSAVHLLVIGYSAYDQSALRIFTESESAIQSCYVVNQDHGAAVDVAMRLATAFGLSVNDRQFGMYSGTFGEWARRGIGEFDSWIASRL